MTISVGYTSLAVFPDVLCLAGSVRHFKRSESATGRARAISVFDEQRPTFGGSQS